MWTNCISFYFQDEERFTATGNTFNYSYIVVLLLLSFMKRILHFTILWWYCNKRVKIPLWKCTSQSHWKRIGSEHHIAEEELSDPVLTIYHLFFRLLLVKCVSYCAKSHVVKEIQFIKLQNIVHRSFTIIHSYAYKSEKNKISVNVWTFSVIASLCIITNNQQILLPLLILSRVFFFRYRTEQT